MEAVIIITSPARTVNPGNGGKPYTYADIVLAQGSMRVPSECRVFGDIAESITAFDELLCNVSTWTDREGRLRVQGVSAMQGGNLLTLSEDAGLRSITLPK